MSHQATTWVLERSEQEGRNFVVLFVIANHCSPDGTGAFPSIDRIAGQARICEKTARTSIQELEDSGELVVARTKGKLPNQEWKSRNTYTIPGVINDGFYRDRVPKPAVSGTAGNQKPAVKPAVKTDIPSGNDLPPNNPKELKELEPELEPSKEGVDFEPENKPCRKCGEMGPHRCGGWKGQKARAREKRSKAVPFETELPPKYVDSKPKWSPPVSQPPVVSDKLDDDYPDLKKILARQNEEDERERERRAAAG